MATLFGAAKAEREREEVRESLKKLRADKDTSVQLRKQYEINRSYIDSETSKGFNPKCARIANEAIQLRLREL